MPIRKDDSLPDGAVEIRYAPEPRREMIVHGDEAIDAIVGYRSWRYTAEDGVVLLHSIFKHDVVWVPRQPMVADCYCTEKQRTGWRESRHTCGIYAWSEAVSAVEAVSPAAAVAEVFDRGRTIFVHGEVYLWGKVKIHERGYRAQYAQPGAFYVSDAMPRRAHCAVEMSAIQFDVPLVRVGKRRGYSEGTLRP